MAVDPNNYPLRPNDITADWLAAALQSGGHLSTGASITAMQRRPVGEGVGMLGLIEVITPAYSGDAGDAPKSVVVKYPTEVEANLVVATTFNVYQREVLFYQHVALKAGMRVPKVFFSAFKGETSFIIVMEDLSEYTMGDQVKGCSVARAEVAMRELGMLHASFWEKVDAPEFEFLPYHFPGIHAEAMLGGARAGWDNMVSIFGDLISDEIKANKDRVLDAVPKMQQWLVQHPYTLIHGDFRMDNLMFGTKPEHSALAAIDFQGALRCKGIQDVAYLLSHNMDIAECRANEARLVELWRSTLEANGVTGYTREQAWDDYKRAVLYLWVYVAVISGTLDPSNERGKAFMSAMVSRANAAIRDLNLVSLIDTF
jgi:aminoglycoside/choline kinase family phosphotransferase